jgi:hypothetical protein
MDIAPITSSPHDPRADLARTLTVRPISQADFAAGSATDPGAVTPAARTEPSSGAPRTARPADPPYIGTAHQTNADGDSATFSSKLDQLTDDERRQVDHLKQRDAHVRAHEQAHIAAAGSLYRSGPHFTYKTGPDGERYAVGGDVKIDTSAGRTPEETVAKAARMRAAALAPADPSAADRAVASKAARMEAEARAKLASRTPDDTGPSSRDAGPSETDIDMAERYAIDTYA